MGRRERTPRDRRTDTWPHSPPSSAASRMRARAGLESPPRRAMAGGAGVRPAPAGPSYGLARGVVALPHFLPTPRPWRWALIGREVGGGVQGAPVGSM